MEGRVRAGGRRRRRADERDGQFSPDGQWIAYATNRSGRFEIAVRLFPGPGPEVPVSIGGGAQVRWRADGRELYYLSLTGSLMAVLIQPTASRTLDIGSPVELFKANLGRVVRANPGAQYAVSNDGQRFLMNAAVMDAPKPIRIIVNWNRAR